ncbi:MAG TPA: lipoate--protein ligase family protein [bacterium]|nr:lipoate--protein ligase family protein [bacterium]
MEWELHQDPPRSAAYNMAKDEVCLERAHHTGRPALRLYGWEHLTLSIGRAQQVAREIDLAACRAAAVPLVRRITGGRAVLHGSDLTYAVTAPTSLPGFEGGIMPIYRALSQVFVRFLRELDCRPEVKTYTGRERIELASAICFSTPSAFEILVEGRKLIGSAQRRLPTAFLQHGSLPLAPQWPLLARLFVDASEASLREQMTDLESLGVAAHWSAEALRERLVAAFAAELDVTFVPARWDAQDEAAVQALLPRYAPPEMTSPAAPPRTTAAGD